VGSGHTGVGQVLWLQRGTLHFYLSCIKLFLILFLSCFMIEKLDSKMDYQNFRGRFEKSENPKDKRFLKYCFVCTEEAKPGKEHLKNYGGIVCLSCRAFWRRSHQTTKYVFKF